MHVLITGAPGVCKSTLISRAVAELNCPLFGFETKKETALAEERKGSPVYLYEAGAERKQSEENLAGWCEHRQIEVYREVFDRYAANLRVPVPEGSIVVMDEIGTMEAVSEEFCHAVLALLDGDAPVIAAVKSKDTPFLRAVRSHPNCVCFELTPENREDIYGRVLSVLKK